MSPDIAGKLFDDESNEIGFDRPSVFDRIEDRIQDEQSARPFREASEDVADQIPEPPGGIAGEGDVLGAVGVVLARSGQLAVLPVPGIKQPGYNVISHGVEEFEDFERHTVNVSAATRLVAQTVAEYIVSAPSNIDYVTGETEIVSIEERKHRSTFSTWEFKVDVADRGKIEN